MEIHSAQQKAPKLFHFGKSIMHYVPQAIDDRVDDVAVFGNAIISTMEIGFC